MDRTLLAELAQRFLAGTATEQEKALLHQWFDTADPEEIELVFLAQRETQEDVRERIFAALQGAISDEGLAAAAAGAGVDELAVAAHGQGGVVRLGVLRRIGRHSRWAAAAAAVVVVVSVGGLYFWRASRGTCCGAPKANLGAPVAVNGARDLRPGGNKATLVLGDGSVVDLGAAKNGVIRQIAGTRIDKTNGRLVYNVGPGTASATGGEATTSVGTGPAVGTAAPEMNTIQTPRGGQYQVVLPDGTRVWLNAASSLTYPTAFTGGNRDVQLKGEAYFEVAENKDKPFSVMVGGTRVDVLGTHFNVMAYDDENAIRTTLLEGAVKVSKGGISRALRPGQEAAVDRRAGSLRTLDVDAAEAVAWKNGVFRFGGVPIETVMREIARWYDVDVEYEGRTNEHFRGTISRSVNASEVFRMLELTGAVHFTIEGRKVIVRP